MTFICILFKPCVNELVFFLVSFQSQGVDLGNIFVELFVNNQATKHREGFLDVFFKLEEDDFKGRFIDDVLADGGIGFEGPWEGFSPVSVGGAVGVKEVIDEIKDCAKVCFLEWLDFF